MCGPLELCQDACMKATQLCLWRAAAFLGLLLRLRLKWLRYLRRSSASAQLQLRHIALQVPDSAEVQVLFADLAAQCQGAFFFAGVAGVAEAPHGSQEIH